MTARAGVRRPCCGGEEFVVDGERAPPWSAIRRSGDRHAERGGQRGSELVAGPALSSSVTVLCPAGDQVGSP